MGRKTTNAGSTLGWAFFKKPSTIFGPEAEAIATERKYVHQPKPFQTHFHDFRQVKTEKGIHDEDTYNLDQTGFGRGQGKSNG